MKDIIHWYNINRKRIWKIIGIVVVVILGIKVIERIWVGSLEEERLYMMQENKEEKELSAITVEDNKSVISGQTLTPSQNNALETLNNFIDYCNNANVNEAYNLLSEDCKKEMYPTTEKFEINYYNKIFGKNKKNVSVENWIYNIYKVNFIDDPLSTGKYNTENKIQDYITIVEEENDNLKINLNNYIGKKIIDKEKEYKNIKIKVVEKKQYMDFETYTFEITNNTEYNILLNDNNNLDTMYLEDKNNIKYLAYVHELSEAELTLLPGETKKVNIKYNNRFSSTRKIENIVFSKIIMNNLAYTNQTLGYYNDFELIKVEI